MTSCHTIHPVYLSNIPPPTYYLMKTVSSNESSKASPVAGEAGAHRKATWS